MDRVGRIVTSGFEQLPFPSDHLLGSKQVRPFSSLPGKSLLQLTAYKPAMLNSLIAVAEKSELVGSVKKALYGIIVLLVTQEGLLQTLNKAVGGSFP